MGCFTPVRCFRDFAPAIPIPEIYWNVDSAEERILAICNAMKAIVDYAESIGVDVTELQQAVSTLESEFEEFKQSGFVDYYEQQLSEWIAENMPQIIGEAANMVYFGLTDDGHFCAYIPDSWNDVTFDTGAVWGRSDYGRLILRFESVEGEGIIDNTYSYTLAEDTPTEQIIADLESVTRRNDATYETLFTNIGEDVITNGTD